MTEVAQFFLIFLGTIIVTRLVLLPQRILYPRIFGYHVHHFVYGIVLVVIALFLSNLFLYAVGLGLFVDELPLVFTQKWSWYRYNSALCRIEDVAIIVAIFLLRSYILLPISFH